MFGRIREVRAESEALKQLRVKICDYFDRSDWALLDMIALAACTSVPAEQVSDAVAANALLYHALRMLDDVLDCHQDYKGGQRTLFGELSGDAETVQLASAGNLLPVMIMMASTITSTKLTEEDRRLIERTLMGMLHESFPGSIRSLESYREIAMAKMGAYGLFLYRPVLLMFEAATQKRLERFLARSFFVSQVINDLHDRHEDEARRQPNYWFLVHEPQDAVGRLIREISVLSWACSRVAPPARDYAHARVADLIGYILKVIPNHDQNWDRWAGQTA